MDISVSINDVNARIIVERKVKEGAEAMLKALTDANAIGKHLSF